jgi:hypothetical protein
MLNNSSQDIVAESRPLFGGGMPWRIRLSAIQWLILSAAVLVIAIMLGTGYSYCVMIFLRVRDAATAPQQGHRMIVLLRARLNRTRMVAIEFGTWRSGRKGRSSGSIIVG